MVAYIDPSVMTYTIQAVAGIAIAIGAAVGIYFRKAKKKVSDKLGIDENRNKEVESDEIVVKKETKTEEKKAPAKKPAVKKTPAKKTTTKSTAKKTTTKKTSTTKKSK